ncbi:hypothetical protein SIN8267_02398 [Sinobacterium norvegicum]|uniref:Glycosyl transferase family 1 domain-containing protein n=1 Tax=Sinobacterium norvegicum TaxID=1641715 RepID=A0ABM9AGE2_9GAMM|nr:glycosyltransferase family 1 protein [Sinobacterium norvegicum]CAH0992279.1 hypothetical protein SIN8267_02398 [Sinobacterium norvegicum]
MSKVRLLIECTYVFENPKMKSGIQRVVRNVINNLNEIESYDYELIPVAFKGAELYQVVNLDVSSTDSLVKKLQSFLTKVRHRYWHYFGVLSEHIPFSQSLVSRRLLYLVMRAVGLSFSLPLKLVNYISENHLEPKRALPLYPAKGDVLVLLDSSWHGDFFPHIEALKKQGVSLVSVIYDLIPLTHPQFCDEHLVDVFENWFSWIANKADGYMCISNTIKEQVQLSIAERLSQRQVEQRWFSSFYLGSDLDEVVGDGEVRNSLKSIFVRSASVYSTVSTIEPRKNHAYQLDAFELLWQQGVDVRLCIVGKVGWKCKHLIDRIRNHPEYNTRLFMFNDLTDDELLYTYNESKSLVFTSYVEGFGLPLVEASQRNLRVICSDIPVFKEVGGNNFSYCDLYSPSSLARIICDYESSGVFPAEGVMDGKWLSWRQSTQQFVSHLISKLKETQ